MESTRRPFNRTISTEPGLKKPRLIEEPVALNRSISGRGGLIPRQSVSSPGLKLQRERDAGINDSILGAYHPQGQQQMHQELVDQYRTALSELTFNSKPIITNLTIIAGENVLAAKAIAATVCTNILEVPSEQKLPSLYLLDSIVKNIGRDYIKHFASRLPEVFCKVYRQVDPAVHPGMRHLFGTWKGVFPAQALQIIAEELGFTSTTNGSSSGTTSTKPISQVPRTSHSIHVNPKYLEARRLQTSGARGAVSDVSGSLVNSDEDVEAQERSTSISSVKPWSDPFAKNHQREKVHEPWYGSGSDFTGKISSQTNGLDMKPESYVAVKPVHTDSRLQLKQSINNRSVEGISKSWKNSEEEEFVWDGLTSRPPDRSAVDASSARDHWAPDNYERLDFDGHIRRPRSMHDDETSADPISMDMRELASGTRVPLSLPQDLQPSKKRMLSMPDKTTLSYSTGLKNSTDPVGRTHYLPQSSAAHVEANAVPGPKLSTIQPRPTSFPAQTSAYRSSTGPPTDPRKPPAPRNTGPSDPFSQDSIHLPSRDAYQATLQRLQPEQSSLLPPQQKKPVPSTQTRKREQPEFESSGIGQNLLRPQIEPTGQSITSSLLASVMRSGILGNSSLTGSITKPDFQEIGLPASTILPKVKLEQQPLPLAPSSSNPVSSLLSSLMAKGLITGSKSDPLPSSTSLKPSQPLGGVAITSSVPSVPVKPKAESFTFKPTLKASESPTHSTEKTPESPARSAVNIRDLIGFEFKPNVVRTFHPDVVTDLFTDLPYECNVCGLKLKLQERLDRHMEWHASKVPLNKWYVDAGEWVEGPPSFSPSDMEVELDEDTERSFQMVPADENQCACILCGELFEDYYSRERDEWMFKEAVYLKNTSGESLDTIVHASCMSEDSARDLGLACVIKQEKDT